MTKYDWDTIEHQYTHGINKPDGTKYFPTYDELSERHQCPKGTIGSRATKDDWVGEKEKIANRIKHKVSEKKTLKEASDIVETDQILETTGMNLLKLIQRKIKVNWDNLDTPNGFVRDYDVKNLSDALKNVQHVIKVAQGEPSEISKVEANVEYNESLLSDPDYIAAKRKAMDEYYVDRRNKE